MVLLLLLVRLVADASKMTSTSILVRKSDGKKFHVTFLSHWSDIASDDGETDYVKWGWDNEYVSHSKGHSYLLEATK